LGGCLLLVALVCLCAQVFSPTRALAAEASIVATVDKNEATLEDYIVLKLSVEGVRAEPSLPDMPAFTVQSRGSSTKVSIINGQMSSSNEYTYLLYPKTAGDFTLGPFTIRHQGKDRESNQIAVRIHKGEPLPQQQQQQEDRDVFVVAEVDNDKPYLNEQIIYKLKFFRRVKVANARLTEAPSMEGFIAEQLGKEQEFQRVINGQTYLVTEITQALFPTRTGVLEIAPTTLQCDVVTQRRRQRNMFRDPFFDDSFFGFSETVPKAFRTAPITVMVKPLPAAGQPRTFSNLVGQFSLSSALSKKKVEAGESVTLTVQLSGTGNLQSQQALDIPGLENFKVYDDKPVFESKVLSGRRSGQLTLKKALVPLKAGTLTVPPITVAYFNPNTGTYEQATTKPHVLEVLPSAATEKLQAVEGPRPPSPKEDVKLLGQDVLEVHTGLDALEPCWYMPAWLIALCFFLPVGGFVGLHVSRRVRDSRASNPGMARARNAHKNFKKLLPEIRRALKCDEARFYQLAARAFKDFMGDKLKASGGALTAAELADRLAPYRVPADVVQEARAILEFLEAGQFGFKQHAARECEAIFKSMKHVAAVLDRRVS